MDNMGEPEIDLTENLSEQIERVLEKDGIDGVLKKELKENLGSTKIQFRLVKQVHDVLSKSGDGEKKMYLHEMIAGSTLHIPEYIAPPRNPELEARCEKLRIEQDNKRYKAMVKNIDRSKVDYFSPGKDVKEMNRQIMSVVNFVVTVLGAFAFGYKATEYTFGGGNAFALQLGAGLTLATIVFFADLYFLLKESE